MGVDRQSLVHMVSGLGVIGAPTVRPDPGWPRQPLTRAQDDADRFVIEDERKTGHAVRIGKLRATSAWQLNHYQQSIYNSGGKRISTF